MENGVGVVVRLRLGRRQKKPKKKNKKRGVRGGGAAWWRGVGVLRPRRERPGEEVAQRDVGHLIRERGGGEAGGSAREISAFETWAFGDGGGGGWRLGVGSAGRLHFFTGTAFGYQLQKGASLGVRGSGHAGEWGGENGVMRQVRVIVGTRVRGSLVEVREQVHHDGVEACEERGTKRGL